MSLYLCYEDIQQTLKKFHFNSVIQNRFVWHFFIYNTH